MIDTGLKKKVKPSKAVTVLKQDRQAFGTLLSKSVDLEEAFAYPVTSVPLSIANPDSTIRQSSKHLLRNHLIEESHSLALTSPSHCRWIIDGMAAMRSLKAKETYSKWFMSLLSCIKPADDPAAISIEMINDTYRRNSVKSGTRSNRGESLKRVHIEGFDQKMVQGNDWLSFFNHIENKSALVKAASRFFRQAEIRSAFKTEMIFAEEEKTWRITKHEVSEIFQCSHEEADTRMVLHACLQDINVVVVSKDTDVLILFVYAFSVVQPEKDWYMKIDKSKYVEIGKVCRYLGEDVCLKLPKIHAVTG